MSTKLLAFSPVSNIWVHAFLECLVAEGARDGGMDVTHVACGGLLDSHCVAMEEAGLEPLADRAVTARVCSSCKQRASRLQQNFAFESRTLSDYVTAGDRACVDDQVNAASWETWADIQFDGVPVGRFAAYEFLLKYKISGFEIPEHLWPIYQGQLRNALRVHLAAPRLLDDLQPDVAMAYNTLYSMNRVFKAHCEKRGIPCYSLQGGLHPRHRLETLTIFRDDAASLSGSRSPAWSEAKGEPVDETSTAVVMEAVRELFDARSAFVYSSKHTSSPAAETRASLGLRTDRKTALVALSSRDEMFAADVVGRFSQAIDGTFVFPTQIAWLEHIITLARRRNDLQFIVRVHPREFPNKREQVLSPNVRELSRVLSDIPENVIVDWPTDGRGFFDVLQVCDAVLTGWSSVGAESALFGMPVVIYDTGELLGYPVELARVARSEDEYEQLVDEALVDGVQIDRVRLAFRWYSFAYRRLSVDLSESIPSRADWSARRILQGLRSQTRVPIPLWPILGLEGREMRQRATSLVASPVIVDTFTHRRASAAESAAWPTTEAISSQAEDEAIMACVREMVDLLGDQPNESQSLSARLQQAADRASARRG
jgi:hypothetical protein